MRKGLLVFVALLALAAFPVASWADTDPCATASSGGVTATVCYTYNGSNQISIDSVYLNGNTSDTGPIKVFANDTSGSITSSITGDMTLNNPDCSSFSNVLTCWGANNGFSTLAQVFGVSGFSVGSTSLEFHFGAFANQPNCSIKISTILSSTDTTATFLSAPSSTDCGTPTTPEPASLGLLASGLAAMAGLAGRRLFRR